MTKCVTQCAENNIKDVAKARKDFKLLGKIDGVDLRARETMYHDTCRRDYVRRDDRVHHVVEEKNAWLGGKEQREAYSAAFEYLCNHINQHIILGGTVERMTMLREKYLKFIQDNTPQFYNPNHQTFKLKNKLVSHCGNTIKFWQQKK